MPQRSTSLRRHVGTGREHRTVSPQRILVTTPMVFLVPRIPGATRQNYRRDMTIAGAVVTAVTLPVLLGQVLYAISRGKPTRERRD
jgi:hypothetical protein